MTLTKLYPTISRLCLRLALIRIILDCYREEITKKKKVTMEFWLDRIYQAFHSSNDVYQLLRKSYIPRIDPRSVKAVREGATFTVIPFGYIRKRSPSGEAKLVKCEKDAKIIRLMYKLKLENKLTAVEIFNRLKKLGYPHRHHASIPQTLLNPMYCGKFRYNGELIDGTHEPIVSEETFNTVSKQILDHRKNLASRPTVRLFPLKHSVKLKEGLRSLNGSYGKQNYLYYRDTMINIPKSFNIRLHQFHSMFKGFLKQNLPVQLKWIAQNQESIYKFFLENSDKLELINENEIYNTNGQYSQVKDLFQKEQVLDFLKERLDAFIEVRKLIQEFRDKDKFDKAVSAEISRASNWDSENYDSQIQIQHLLFPKGLLFDEDIHQFMEVK